MLHGFQGSLNVNFDFYFLIQNPSPSAVRHANRAWFMKGPLLQRCEHGIRVVVVRILAVLFEARSWSSNIDCAPM